jgi:hypothetical protein
MAVVLEISDLLVCRKIHGCGCFADDPVIKSPKILYCPFGFFSLRIPRYIL